MKPDGKEPAAAKTVSASDTIDGKVTINAPGDFLIVTAEFPSSETRAPELLIDGAPAPDVAIFAPKDRLWRMAWKPATMGARHELRVRHPRIQDAPLLVDTINVCK